MSKSKLFVILSAVALLGAGCISVGRGPTGNDGGVFKSINRGEEWQHTVAVPTPSGVKNFAAANVRTLAIDPQDNLAIYAGTAENGLLYSFDGGQSWKQAKDIAGGFVPAVSVDPEDKCTVYAAVNHRMVKSTDCNRTFQEIYREPSEQTYITALAIDPFNTRRIYAGTVKGTLIKSVDSGKTWTHEALLSRNQVVDIVPDPRAEGVRYVALRGRGVWKTADGGKNFSDITEALKPIRRAVELQRLIPDGSALNGLIFAAKHTIGRTADGGRTWEEFTLISPDSVEISAIAVSPKNSAQIYYGTATTLYRSSDGGKSWSTKKLPSSRAASALLVDPEDPETIYMGVKEIKK